MRAVADQRQTCLGQRVEQRAQPLDPLLRTEPADIEEERAVPVGPQQTAAHLIAPPSGMEAVSVDPSPPAQAKPRKPMVAELRLHRTRDAEIAVRFRMHPAQHLPRHRLQRAEAVVPEVARQVGVEGADQRHPVAAGVIDRVQAQQSRIHRVDEVRPELVQLTIDGGPRERHRRVRVGRECKGAHAADAHTRMLGGSTLSGHQQEYCVAPLRQVPEGLAEAGYDSVGLGEEGLADDGDA